jgi:hypothetical protein
MGNRKKLEKVRASKTSLTDTAMNNPRNAEDMAISIIAGIKAIQMAPDKSVRKTAMIIGTNALAAPNRMAPDVFASISRFREMGANSNLSNEQLRFSKVTVTASIEVVPKRMEIATTPGRILGILSNPLPDLIKNILVHASGNIKPQLILGGFR